MKHMINRLGTGVFFCMAVMHPAQAKDCFGFTTPENRPLYWSQTTPDGIITEGLREQIKIDSPSLYFRVRVQMWIPNDTAMHEDSVNLRYWKTWIAAMAEKYDLRRPPPDSINGGKRLKAGDMDVWSYAGPFFMTLDTLEQLARECYVNKLDQPVILVDVVKPGSGKFGGNRYPQTHSTEFNAKG